MQQILISKCNNVMYVLVVGKWLALPGFLSFHHVALVPCFSWRGWERYRAQHGRGKPTSHHYSCFRMVVNNVEVCGVLLVLLCGICRKYEEAPRL